MAVIQISKMQVRRGQTAQTNFPQLSSGEFGWSIDQQQLFIGNGAVTEGAPAVGNTEIITEHNVSNFFLYGQSSYTYGTTFNDDGDVVTQIGVTRSVQSKLDDFVNLNDFGDTINVGDDTTIIQNAINYAASIGRPLTIPEGEYIIFDTITIPANTELRGAGPGKTVIRNQSTTSTFQTIDSNGLFFEDMSGDSSSPKNIRINGFTFISSLTNALPIMQLDCVRDSIIEQCEFVGDDAAIGPTANTQATAINFRSIGTYPANITDNVTVKNCTFYRLANGIVSNYDVANIEVTENKFKNLNEGIVLGKTIIPGVSLGPKHIRITNNTFSHINRQAVYAGSTSTLFATDINSINNYYYDVGNNNQGDASTGTVTEVINFGSVGNYSEGDTFERLERINAGGTRESYIGSANTLTTRARSIISGPVTIKSKSPLTFDFSTGVNSMFGYPLSGSSQVISIEYTLVKTTGAVVRRGQLEIIVNGVTATVRDEYTFTGTDTLPVSFSATVWPIPNLLIIYTNTSGPGGNITYTFSARQ